MMLLRRTGLNIKCCQKKENPVQKARKAFEKNRGDSLKENVNKLIAIANKDIKEYGDFIKELDEIHKKELKKDKKPANASAAESIESIDDSSDNIFLDKSKSSS